MSLSFPAFRPRPPWWGPDLQTLRNAVRERRDIEFAPGDRRIVLPLEDGTGDALTGRLRMPETPQQASLVVLIHGLSGCEASPYMHLSTQFWLQRGHAVLRLNLRGAGPSREHCRLQYHAGRSLDLRNALLALDDDLMAAGLVLVGYSLGGNMLLKFLAEYGREFPVRAAASVSAPIDLAAASQRFLAPRNHFYHQHLLQAMKEECFGGATPVSEHERERLHAARSIYEFDDYIVAPRNGFRDAEHYYQENHARRFLASIEVPTLVIQALDDPWIPASAYLDYPWQQNPCLVPLLPRAGGHVGFHDRDDRSPWYNRCIGHFVDHQLERSLDGRHQVTGFSRK
jgi:predicted alpha/beta-fold hydrolase